MPIWLRKSFVVLITILTFGLVTPYQIFGLENIEASQLDKVDSVEAFSEELDHQVLEGIPYRGKSAYDSFIDLALFEAEAKAYEKFGTKIKPVIEDEFKTVILPEIEKAIKAVAQEFPEDKLSNLIISEVPGSGTSEKIFHIVDGTSKKDIVRFHVRRDLPPNEGYWFNFHYHSYKDQFQTHHSLGSIYWSKNTPPNWMN